MIGGPSLLDFIRQGLASGGIQPAPQPERGPATFVQQLEASLEERRATPKKAGPQSLADLFGEETISEEQALGVQQPSVPVQVQEVREARADEPAEPAEPAPPSADDGGCELATYVDEFPPFSYVRGPAGVGKTFWAKTLAARDPAACVLAATTGIAAVNLGEGTTINALLRYFNTASLTEAYTGGYLESSLKRLRGTGLRRILLDEVSMMDGDQLTLITRAIDNVNADRTGDDPDLGLILVGDFAQLSPVEAPFAFESAEWARYQQHTFGLTCIRRQADRAYIQALQAVRRGAADEALAYFATRMSDTTLQQFDGPTVVAKNDAVDKYNQLAMDRLATPWVRFPSQRWGKVRADWGGPPKPPASWEIPEVLAVKEGSRVMILANRNIAERGDPPEYAYVNGDLGTFHGPASGGAGASVTLNRTGDTITVVPVTRDNVIPLEPGRRKELREARTPERIKDKWEIIGQITYMPLRLAYATTVHKSQGLSLDQVQVNIRDHFFRHPGMLYVALSRARSIDGLRLVGTPTGFRARCTVNPKIKPWL